MLKLGQLAIAGTLLVAAMSTAGAQQAAPPQYGAPITLETARKAMAAAEAEAVKNSWPMAIIILDSGGHTVMLHRLDNTQYGSVGVAEDKARSAVNFRRPTKAFEDALAQGGAGLRILTLRGANAVEGGVPILVDGKIVGAIGVSGGTAPQDGQVAKAGVDAVSGK